MPGVTALRPVRAAPRRYGRWLSQSPIPKLSSAAKPGALLVARAARYARGWPNRREVTVKGIHYMQEDSPAEIGTALRELLADL